MTPSRFQAEAGGTDPPGASQRVSGAPPLISSRLRLPAAVKISDLLSGDQVGKFPPSVPGSARADSESSGRTHKDGPPFPRAVKMIERPSGDTAKPPYRSP